MQSCLCWTHILSVCEESNYVCNNGGTCVNVNGKPRCHCPMSFSGEFCNDIKGSVIEFE